MPHFNLPTKMRDFPTENTNRGTRYVPYSKAFIEGLEYGIRLSGEKLEARVRDKCPELLEGYTRELTPSDMAKFLSLGGTHPAMGEQKFILKWEPSAQAYRLYDMAGYWNQTDASRLLGKQATRVKELLRMAKDIAADVYNNLSPTDQAKFLRQYEQEIKDLGVVSHWGETEGLTLEGAIEELTGLKLTNGNGPKPVKK